MSDLDVISNMAEGLKERLETIEGMTVYDAPPDAGVKFPHIVIEPPTEGEPLTMKSTAAAYLTPLTIRALAARGSAGWRQLYGYLAHSGDTSIAATIREDPTLGERVDWARWESFEQSDRDPDNPLLFVGTIFIRWAKSDA